jgi:hypothetical protein
VAKVACCNCEREVADQPPSRGFGLNPSWSGNTAERPSTENIFGKNFDDEGPLLSSRWDARWKKLLASSKSGTFLTDWGKAKEQLALEVNEAFRTRWDEQKPSPSGKKTI